MPEPTKLTRDEKVAVLHQLEAALRGIDELDRKARGLWGQPQTTRTDEDKALLRGVVAAATKAIEDMSGTYRTLLSAVANTTKEAQ